MQPHRVCQELLRQGQQLQAWHATFGTTFNTAAEQLGNARDAFAAVLDQFPCLPEHEEYGVFEQLCQDLDEVLVDLAETGLKFSNDERSTDGSTSSGNQHLRRFCRALNSLQIELISAPVGATVETTPRAGFKAGISMKLLIEAQQNWRKWSSEHEQELLDLSAATKKLHSLVGRLQDPWRDLQQKQHDPLIASAGKMPAVDKLFKLMRWHLAAVAQR
eukprot:gene4698-4950_t